MSVSWSVSWIPPCSILETASTFSMSLLRRVAEAAALLINSFSESESLAWVLSSWRNERYPWTVVSGVRSSWAAIEAKSSFIF